MTRIDRPRIFVHQITSITIAMDENKCFTSAEQMAGWLAAGGNVISKKQPNIGPIDLRGILMINVRFSDYCPHGDLPDNWCPFQELISNANQAFISACNEADEEKMAHYDGMKKGLIEAKKQLLKSIDPRIS